jgi:hypothetical protein
LLISRRGGPKSPLEHHQRVQFARALLPQLDERLIFGCRVPRVESVHVGEFDDDGALWFLMAALGQLVASALGQIQAAKLRDYRADLDAVLLELGRICDDVLDDQLSRHTATPPCCTSRNCPNVPTHSYIPSAYPIRTIYGASPPILRGRLGRRY